MKKVSKGYWQSLSDSEKMIHKIAISFGVIYTIISFKKGRKRYNKKELYFGPCLLSENSKLFQEQNRENLKILNKLLEVIPKNHRLHRMNIKRKIKMYDKIKTMSK